MAYQSEIKYNRVNKIEIREDMEAKSKVFLTL